MNRKFRLDVIDASITLAMESIAFQQTGLHERLSDCIASIRKNYQFTTEGLADSGLAALIKAVVGLNVTFQVIDSAEHNAAVMPPIIDRNHPFYNEVLRTLAVEHKEFTETTMRIVSKAGNLVAGSVNRSNGTVSGIFEKWNIPVYITSRMLRDPDYSDRELSAAILHELGHVITYFEYLGLVSTSNFLLAGTVALALRTDNFGERATIIAATAADLNVDVDVAKLANIPDPVVLAESIPAVILAAQIEKSFSSTGTSVYDIRSWEQLADAFAIRHGCGRDLATGLDKLHRKAGVAALTPWPTFLAMQALNFSAWVVMGGAAMALATVTPIVALLPIGVLAAFVFIDPNGKVYDDPAQRIASVRRQMTEELKNAKLSKERRKAIVEDIKLVESIEAQMADKRDWWQTFSSYIIPTHAASRKKELGQKKLEELINSRLFIRASQLQTQGVK